MRAGGSTQRTVRVSSRPAASRSSATSTSRRSPARGTCMRNLPSAATAAGAPSTVTSAPGRGEAFHGGAQSRRRPPRRWRPLSQPPRRDRLAGGGRAPLHRDRLLALAHFDASFVGAQGDGAGVGGDRHRRTGAQHAESARRATRPRLPSSRCATGAGDRERSRPSPGRGNSWNRCTLLLISRMVSCEDSARDGQGGRGRRCAGPVLAPCRVRRESSARRCSPATSAAPVALRGGALRRATHRLDDSLVHGRRDAVLGSRCADRAGPGRGRG